MAKKRMFSRKVVLSDAFLDMPMSARCLYFTLSMLGDDDGFVDAPKSVMRLCGASKDDMKILVEKKFIILFDSGIGVIRHWKINNLIRNDRYAPTEHTEEKNMLVVDENLTYAMRKNGVHQKGALKTLPPPRDDEHQKSDIEKIEDAYLENYQRLYQNGILRCENPIMNWSATKEVVDECIAKYGFDMILEAVKKSVANEFCIKKGYSLTTILSAGVLSVLINGFDGGTVREEMEERRKTTRQRIFDTRPKNCRRCGSPLTDTADMTVWCWKCNAEFGLRGNEWVEI